MNKAVAAGIGIITVLIAIGAFSMMNQSEESNKQVELSEEVEMKAGEEKSYEVELEEGITVGTTPP